MEFDPRNPIVKLCIQGMDMESKGRQEEAERLFHQAWSEASNDHEKFISAYYVARHQKDLAEKLKWTQITLDAGLKINDNSVMSAFPSLYLNLAKCYEELGDTENAKKNYELSASANDVPFDGGPFYHGTRADLKVGDFLTPGGNSNYKADLVLNHVYFTGLVNGAGLAAALAKGEGRERVYIVEPTGTFENDPNVTDKKFPGNPTRSYRTKAPLRIVGEVTDWVRHSPEDIQKFKDRLANVKGDIIN